MACLRPRLLKNRLKEIVSVPCGQCLSCRLDKQTYYEFLGNCASQQARLDGFGSCLCTLTYDEEHLPVVPYSDLATRSSRVSSTLVRSDLTKFIKRLRIHLKRSNYPYSPRYIACGEYGGSTADKRPHYHIVFFGLNYEIASSFIRKSWKKGFVQCGALREGGVRYVVDYVVKQQFGKTAKEIYDAIGRSRPFWQRSVALGLEYMLDLIDFNDWTYISRGVKRSVPYLVRHKLLAGNSSDAWKKAVCRSADERGLSVSDYLSVSAHDYASDYVVKCRQRGVAVEDVPLFSPVSEKDVSCFASNALASE